MCVCVYMRALVRACVEDDCAGVGDKIAAVGGIQSGVGDCMCVNG